MSGSGINKTSSSNSLTPSTVQPDSFVSPRSKKDDGIPNNAVFSEQGKKGGQPDGWDKFAQAGLFVAGGLFGMVLMSKAGDADGGSGLIDESAEAVDNVVDAVPGLSKVDEGVNPIPTGVIGEAVGEIADAVGRRAARLSGQARTTYPIVTRNHPFVGSVEYRKLYEVLGIDIDFDAKIGKVEVTEPDLLTSRPLSAEARAELEAAGLDTGEGVNFTTRSHQARIDLRRRIGSDAENHIEGALYYINTKLSHMDSPLDTKDDYGISGQYGLKGALDRFSDDREFDLLIALLEEARQYARLSPNVDSTKVERLAKMNNFVREYRKSRQPTP